MRILVDLSAQYVPGQEVPQDILRLERDIARRLLDDVSLNTLPVVFWNDRIYALDRHAVTTTFGSTTSAPAYESACPHRAADEPSLVTAGRANGSAPPLARGSPRPVVVRQMLRAASSVGRRVINVVPERARPDARQSLLYARNALTAVLQAPQSKQAFFASSASVALLDVQRLATVVRPAREHIIWTCGSVLDAVPLRQLSETKLTTGFRVASICYGLSASRQTDWGTHDLAEDVLATRIVDLLDAADLVFCVSSDVQSDLDRFASACGRPTPNSRVVPHSTGTTRAAVVSAVHDGLRTLALDERSTRA